MRTNRAYHPAFPRQSTCKRAGQIPDSYCITRQRRRLSGRNISGGKTQYKHSKLCLLDFFLSSSHSNHISLFFAWNLFFVLTSGCLMSLFVLGPGSQKYNHLGSIALALQWSCCNKNWRFVISRTLVPLFTSMRAGPSRIHCSEGETICFRP